MFPWSLSWTPTTTVSGASVSSPSSPSSASSTTSTLPTPKAHLIGCRTTTPSFLGSTTPSPLICFAPSKSGRTRPTPCGVPSSASSRQQGHAFRVPWHRVQEHLPRRSARDSLLHQSEAALPVIAYCTKVKLLADQLCDLGSPVSDLDLVITLLRGLNTRLQHVIPGLTVNKLPPFLKVRSHLLLEEHHLDNAVKMAQAAALFASQQAAGGSTPGVALPAPLSLATQVTPGSPSTPPSFAGESGKKLKFKKKGSGSPSTGPRQNGSA
jgi:hypothetical protein